MFRNATLQSIAYANIRYKKCLNQSRHKIFFHQLMHKLDRLIPILIPLSPQFAGN
jgi:hypothetical protein